MKTKITIIIVIISIALLFTVYQIFDALKTDKKNKPAITKTSDIEYKILNKEIFGLKLGQYYEDVIEIYNLETMDEHIDEDNAIDAEIISTFTYDHLSEGSMYSCASFYDGQVCSIITYLKDSSRTNLVGIVNRLKDKYNIIDYKEPLLTDDECILLTEIDDEAVLIRVTRRESFKEDTTLTVQYGYCAMIKIAGSEMEEKKSSSIANDL